MLTVYGFLLLLLEAVSLAQFFALLLLTLLTHRSFPAITTFITTILCSDLTKRSLKALNQLVVSKLSTCVINSRIQQPYQFVQTSPRFKVKGHSCLLSIFRAVLFLQMMNMKNNPESALFQLMLHLLQYPSHAHKKLSNYILMILIGIFLIRYKTNTITVSVTKVNLLCLIFGLTKRKNLGHFNQLKSEASVLIFDLIFLPISLI